MDCKSFASGGAERVSESIDASPSEELAEECLEASRFRRSLPFICRFVEDGLAHSGTGYRRSNCWRSRLVYSLPFTRSSDSVFRNLRSRGLEASDTVIRSSSLSIHAGVFSL